MSAAEGSKSRLTIASIDSAGSVADLDIAMATSGHCHFACRAAFICAHKSFLHDLDLRIERRH